VVYLIAILAGAAVTLTVVSVAGLLPERPRTVARELGRLEQRRRQQYSGAIPRERADARTRLVALLRRLGSGLLGKQASSEPLRQMLVQAGYRSPDAVTVFRGARVILSVVLPAAALSVSALAGADGRLMLLTAAWAAALGWTLPPLVLRQRIRQRRREILRFLPDALDLLVICVEAGLGLNQALSRMAEELRHFSPVTASEFALVNLEIRAGASREQALRGLAARTDVAELRALASMLVQTDRFGTSIAQALRVHSHGLRTRWQQRMEEAAAKTTVKLVFPLVLCILPVLFAIILGPALIRLVRSLSGM
jgi:tight adherence protein C